MAMRRTILAMTALALAGCGKPADKAPKPPIPVSLAPPSAVAPKAAAQPGEEPMTLRYAGDLPCADCPGIRTELTLTRKAKGWAEGTYRLTETYLERGGPNVTTGDWTTLRGDAADPDATVYQLDPDHPVRSRNFLRVGDDLELKVLDKDMKALPATLPVTLKRVR